MCFFGVKVSPSRRGGAQAVLDRWGARRAGGGGGGRSRHHMKWRLTTGAARTTMTATPRTAARCGASTSTLTRTRYDSSRKQRERERERERESTLGIPAHAGNISTKRRTLRRFDSFLTPAYGSITLVCLSLCSQVRALNEEVPGSCKDLFRSWEDRLDLTKVCLPTDQYSHPILAAGTVL